MSTTFPGESPEYRVARDELLGQEIELRRAMECVAATRLALPPGGVIPEDYIFRGAGPDGTPTAVRLSDLFASDMDSLVIYNRYRHRAVGNWARRRRPFRGSSGVNTEVDTDRERHDSRMER